MKTLVLDPDSVRAALEPSNNPRAVVWMVTIRGEIIVNSLDEGWLRYIPPEHVTDKKWAAVVREAAEAIRYRFDSAMAVYHQLLDNTDPCFPFNPTGTIHVRKKFPDLHVVHKAKERKLSEECPECHIAVVVDEFTPYCGPICESKAINDGTKIGIRALFDDEG